ncbi:3-hydroxy-9,10-secoandrosta-1,3,5(10)-triene-9,17-dione monooxygenase oxygenase subunit [Nocardia tengchongensis]|uniref:3-hydroxy-9,10-secoandrosta-1,3,5(10)-triene-9, 17-dione monooxygenase oxygenase subunit n=1 Tax=Nocardia tengchongensis TaxID=2055889 RepID=UPI003605AFD8
MSHELIDRIDRLLPMLRDRARETHDKGISVDTMEQLAATGFFRLMQPRQWGGEAADPMIAFEAIRRLSGACGSTGWVASVLGVHPWHLAQFDQQAQQDVWGQDPNALVCSSYAPMGMATPVEGGYRVTGNWRYSSGSAHAQWAMVGAPIPEQLAFGAFLIPRAEYSIDEVWDTYGLRGTQSNTLVVEDVFVPAHRFLNFETMGAFEAPGLQVNDEPLFRMPWGTVFPAAIGTPVIGMAHGAWDLYVEYQGTRQRAAYFGERATDDPFIALCVGETGSDIDASWEQLSGNISKVYDLVVAGEEVPMELRMKARRDQVRAVQRCVAAADTLIESAGAAALDNDQRLQLLWRDIRAARHQATNEPPRVHVMYGRHKFKLDPGQNMV